MRCTAITSSHSLLGHIENHPVAEDAGAGDHDVQLAEAVNGGLDDFLAAFHRCHRFQTGDGLAALLPDFGHHLLGDGLVVTAAVHVDAGVNDNYLRALGGHQLGDAPTHAPTGAGDDGYFVSEYVCHVCFNLGFGLVLIRRDERLPLPHFSGEVGKALGVSNTQVRFVAG